ncbi:bifunctional phosphoribosylaminoimidazolecarboxamide formyltransferase/inosine monophosphate cyclohydrolase [Thermotoga sp. KOL6]|uniref:bifunctional phosphoribosylaminoimidazolecarboxamide formyltransferase/inosine monophosphate cyclohydrolase n=1 Tax=Thermotoga sp. KOL6 TaxID=126741 RepID=UPI000C78616E|nr:bifunctional phosphoribosylaminoimidazolecarboxamide formyltransferase/inosine monophosphate cyclohydrolase [Thermotoga sp. KOL6]PLV59964.1 bifunctional phosphoribosylaminoimidazolecarboxamide formyltransferase/inosine monophosphate cyclohydrolase [Thermotoga sp. KOL6]
MKRILVSLYEKEKFLGVLKDLYESGWEIWASSGTARFLKENGIKANDVSSITGFENLLGGLVKTLHPEIFAGILGPNPRWDVVFVDLYPPPDIDIGGVALLRAAAKNWKNVKPAFDMKTLKLAIERDDEETRKRLAGMTFAFTSVYDSVRANQLVEGISMAFRREEIQLRYGENPHEKASVYGELAFEILHEGKTISFNNILDAENAWFVAKNLPKMGAVVVKHQSPCGAAVGENKIEVVRKAIEADSESSFGGILAVNFEIDEEIARSLKKYLEVIVAPSFTTEAVNILSKKKVRLLKPNNYIPTAGKMAFGSLVLSERKYPEGEFELVVGDPLSEKEFEDIDFAYRVVEGVKSNAVLIVRNGVTVGIGSGQPSRKRSAWIATVMAGDKAKGAVAASDAFFPFPDSLEILAQAGVKAVVAPLGSIRDEEVLSKAKELGLTFYKAPSRVFRH